MSNVNHINRVSCYPYQIEQQVRAAAQRQGFAQQCPTFKSEQMSGIPLSGAPRSVGNPIRKWQGRVDHERRDGLHYLYLVLKNGDKEQKAAHYVHV